MHDCSSIAGKCCTRRTAYKLSLILAINQIGLAEGLSLGRSLGIDPLLLHNVINASSGEETIPVRRLNNLGHSWSSRVNSPLPEVPNSPGSRSYIGGFQTRLMLKVRFSFDVC